MNYFCDSGGVIFQVDPERVFQGSANANVINFFGAFPSNAEVLLAYKLPDGTWTTPQRMTPIVQLSGVLDGKGNAYAGWQTRIGARLKMSNGAPMTDENGNYVYEPDYTITAKYGTVLVQFFVYANGGNGLGAQIATASSSFLVEKGVPIVLPDTPTDDYEALLGQILAAISDKNLQIDTNAENIEALQNDLQETNENVTANVQAIAQNTEAIQTNAENITALQTGLSATNETVTSNGQAIQTLTLSVENGLVASVVLSLNDNYVLTAAYFAKDGSRLGSSQVDFPVESMVVTGGYDNENKTIILTLQNGNVVAIPVGDLVEGLISSTEKGHPNGVATLGADGKVPSDQLPPGQGGSITQEMFNTMLVEGVTSNENTMTDEDKTEACDWLGALKQNTSVTASEQVYSKTAQGKPYMRNVSYTPQGGEIPIYGGMTTTGVTEPNQSTLPFPIPTQPYQAVPKTYVDGKIAELLARIEALENK